jgi:hypothetical protein
MGLFGQGEDGMIIGNRQLLPLSFFQPGLSIPFMTGGTASVFAGVKRVAKMPAMAALEDMAAHRLRAAVDDILDSPSMVGRHV